MAVKPLPDQALLRQLLDYDPATGIFHWKSRPSAMFAGAGSERERTAAAWNTRFAGRRAFTSRMTPDGYYQARLGGHHYVVHRLIWKWAYGRDPEIIDHINGNKGDNRLCNLRDVTTALNARNKPRFCNNTSGHTGVHLCRKTRRWRAELIADGRHIRLGRFDTVEEAAHARRKAASEYGFHENHGR